MKHCQDCRYTDNMGKWPCDDCVKGDKWEEKLMTHADKIRAMTDEELAEWGCALAGCPPGPDLTELCYPEAYGNRSCCYKCWLGWLKQEVDE